MQMFERFPAVSQSMHRDEGKASVKYSCELLLRVYKHERKLIKFRNCDFLLLVSPSIDIIVADERKREKEEKKFCEYLH